MNNDKLILEFYSHTCRPCKLMMPIAEKAAEEAGIPIEKTEISESPEKAKKYGIKSVPAFLLFEGEKEVRRISGAVSKQRFTEFLNS